MIEQEIEIRMPEATSDGMMYHSEDRGRLPGVIFLTDIGGIRPSQREMAQRLAAEGYIVLLPNVFYRVGRPPLIDFPVKIGEERTMKRIGELSASLTPQAVERDASAYVNFLSAHESVADGPMGVVGYCFSGALAMRIAAARPDRIAAAASFHGGRLFTDAPTSPHLLLPRIKAELYFGHAIQDQSMPREAIEKPQPCASGLERPVQRRNLRRCLSRLDRARQSGLQSSSSRTGFRKAEGVVRENFRREGLKAQSLFRIP